MMKKNDAMDEMVGYPISLKQKREILRRVHETGEDLMTLCHQIALPTMVTETDDGKFRYEGKTYTVEELKKAHPYRKFVLIKRKLK